MEESMILGMGDAVEESVEVPEDEVELTTPAAGAEAEVETGESLAAEMVSPPHLIRSSPTCGP